MADDDRTAKAIGRAFSYHPGLWTGPNRTGSWVIGPTFCIYAPEEKAYPQASQERATTLRELIQASGGATVDVGAKPHFIGGTKGTCKSRYLSKDGENRWECAFSLLSVARRVGAKDFRLIEGDAYPTVYGYDDDGVLVAILAGKVRGEKCGPEKVSTPKKVPSRPSERKG